MRGKWNFFLLFVLAFTSYKVQAQRNYAANSVLATGNWYKISTIKAGVYKIDIPFLNNLGVNTQGLTSVSIRLFGSGGGMLSEANNGAWLDDLPEIALQVVDGGDGILNGSDYILFFAENTDKWIKDSANQSFRHQKNLFGDKAYYFLSVGGSGKRITDALLVPGSGSIVSSFSERIFHESDSVNFLNSGKEWYGEEFANAPGKTVSRTFNLPIPDVLPGSAIVANSHLVSRSVGTGSRFDIKLNSLATVQVNMPSVGSGIYDLFATENSVRVNGVAIPEAVTINYTFVPGSFNAQGWLNFLEVFCRRQLFLSNTGQLLFRDWQSVGNSVSEFVIGKASSSIQVWDVTEPLSPERMQGSFSGSEFRFKNHTERLREYVAFSNADYLIPAPEGKISNQNLHNSSPADFIVVTHPSLLSQAERLAAIHRQHDGMRVVVATTEQVYNEFASGSPDPSAIRNFVKMYYDKYKNTPGNAPKYLLLFGDASYDYKNRLQNNTNLVPGWQNNFSLDPLSTYTSDDFFGFLDDIEDVNSGLVNNLLDIGIGRVPAKNITEAKNFVDKIQAYLSPSTFGPWRNTITFVADDEDNNLHLQDAENVSATASANRNFNQQKIYLDAYKQETGPGGSSYPKAIEANNNQVYNGTLIWNFNGHGGHSRLTEETILDQQIINSWKNAGKLPLFITATCDFAPFDNPSINSVGENLLVRPQTGAIALMTTTRLVFAYSNRLINNTYMRYAMEELSGGKYRTLGDAVKEAKNYTYQNSSDISNNRKFTLLGDPALTLGFPSLKIRVTGVNGVTPPLADTISAGEKVTIQGEITDNFGTLANGFDGTVYPLIIDKPQTAYTLGNDPGSQVAGFQIQNQVLYKGQSTVSGGRFSFTFRMPKDLNKQFGNGKLSFYAENGSTDATGIFTDFIAGGSSDNPETDSEGPEIGLFLNDELFANGGITNQSPVLIVKLFDSSGINTAGTGIGHDIVATLDNDSRQYFVLNDFYIGELNNYQKGVVRFQLPVMQPGFHSIKLKAWDVINNSGEAQLDFLVATDEELEISHVLNYPNPFTNGTHFWFEHNKPGQHLQVHIRVMTLTGKIVRTISEGIVTEGTRSASISWNGKDDYGDKLATGVYVYVLRVTAPDGSTKKVINKLVIL